MSDSADHAGIEQQQKVLFRAGLPALPSALAIWLALYYWLPPLANADTPFDRLIFAVKCCCVAVLLCFFTGIEAVSHERLFSKAIDPLIGAESPRLKVNLRYLQHTLEQLMLFIPGLLALSQYAIRAVAPTTLVWMITRAAFWIGYHKGPLYRTPGLMGMLQSAVVLIYVCWKFGTELAGVGGAVAIVGFLAAVEIFLVRTAKRPKDK